MAGCDALGASDPAGGGTPDFPDPAPWRIVSFSPQHQDGVLELILGIQRGEFGLSITAQDQPDLLNIPGFYLDGQHGPGGFWLGLDASGAVAGSVALLNLGHAQGALRKMFVRADLRGAGLAGALLDTLLAWCATSGPSGVAELFLGTTTRFLAAHRFYARQGFRRIDKTELPPRFPVMAVDTVFFARALAAVPQS